MTTKPTWKPCQISPEALQCLKVASTLTHKQQRELASEAIIDYCAKVLAQHGMPLPKRKK